MLHHQANCQNDVSGVRMDSCLSQPFHHYHWPRWWSLHGRGGLVVNNPVEYGRVTLINGTDIEGLITYSDFTKSYDFGVLPRGKESQGEMLLFYVNKKGAELYGKGHGTSINRFRIYADSVQKACYMDFVSLAGSHDLTNYWRILGEKNDIKVVDRFVFKGRANRSFLLNDYVDHADINKHKMLLVTKDSYTKIYGWALFRNVNKSIRRFINKRYHTSFHKNDFKSTGTMIDYILDKENEKI